MKTPLSWLKDFVDLEGINLEELAHTLTVAGLEVEEIHYIGLPMPAGLQQTKVSGLSWDPDKLVVAEIREVGPHPNADRLVLCRLFDGQQEHTVLTGAPNLFEYRGQGELKPPLKVAYAKEGAEIYDGHQEGMHKTVLKRTKIRGVDSYSMVCSEKELGISEEHEGILFLPAETVAGTPLADVLGDAVLTIAITPNIARDANIYGVAREIAALTGRALKPMPTEVQAAGPKIDGAVKLDIKDSELNPRFVLGLIRNVEIKPSPAWVQQRLRLAGMRPINNIVDATNYAMLELGEPLHAFDYDVLVQRAGGKPPTIITRPAKPGETLTTLDDVERKLDDFTVLVCDTAGSLSIGGIMGGLESEVTEATRNVLLEGASWNFINVRKTLVAQRMSSEAAYRFSRGVHPAMAPRGVSRGLELMRQWAGGVVDAGLVDEYPRPAAVVQVHISPADAKRWLGVTLTNEQMTGILASLGFEVTAEGDGLSVTVPDHRLDIETGVVGKADLMEEIARIYGYDNIPATRIGDPLPPQHGNPELELEERVKDALARMGIQEVMTYRLTTPEEEARRLPPGTPPDDKPYVKLANVISQERTVLRKSLLASVLEIAERNARLRQRIALFEIGPVFHASEETLPDELSRLVVVLGGQQQPAGWHAADSAAYDFYAAKGVLAELLAGLGLHDLSYEPGTHPSFHPGKCARVLAGERQLAVFGELHPQVQGQYDLGAHTLQAITLNLEVLGELAPERFDSRPVPQYPPVIEDLALVVDESLPAGQVEAMIAQTGGNLLAGVSLFDVFRGDKIGAGKKSLAYQLTYQHPERTLTDDEVAKLRERIVRRVTQELGAQLRA
ncbi:MAG: phenylalanine--tRNA ligase subunit beta [Anaerolineales bacterium]|nr:MAG: phenylalanine--tRNA ligase subunit beta [Anaerolineales bacterium]